MGQNLAERSGYVFWASFQSFSYECWIKADNLPTAGNWADVIGMESGADAALLRINGSTNKLEFVMGNNIATQVLASNASLQANRWYHVAIIYHYSIGKMYIIINGILNSNMDAPSVTNYSNNVYYI